MSTLKGGELTLISWLRRLASLLRHMPSASLLGAGLAALLIIVALVFSLGWLSSDSMTSVPIIYVGAAVGEQGYEAQPFSGSTNTGFTVRIGRTTVVTEAMRVEPGRRYQGGGTSRVPATTTVASPASGNPSVDPEERPLSTSATCPRTLTPTGGMQVPSSTGGAHGPSSQGLGR